MRTLPLLFVALAITQIGADDSGCGGGPILEDPGFDLWCGDELCSWTLVAGEIKKAPTWHAEDAGVEFLGTESIIEQTSAITHQTTTCIEFEMIANVDANAEVNLDIDVFADGTIDSSERVPTSNWKKVVLLVKLSAPYTGIRFQISKRGNGRATLAQMGARVADPGACDGFSPIVPVPASNVSACSPGGTCH